MPADSVRERILEATYACVARYGLGKTTIEDVSREAKLSRATIYRYVPGGKDQLMSEVIAWEMTRFFVRLADAVAGATGFPQLLEEGLVFAHRAIEEHDVLQKVLVTEPERLLPQLTVATHGVLRAVAAFLEPRLAGEDLQPGMTPPRAAAYLARMIVSYIGQQGRWDLTDRAQVRELVRSELLAGILRDPVTRGTV